MARAVLQSMVLIAIAMPVDRTSAAPFPEDINTPLNEGSLQPIDPVTPTPPTDELDVLTAAKEAFSAGDLAACQRHLREAYAQRPNLPPPKLMLAQFMLTAGQLQPARKMLEEVAVSHPNHPGLYLLFAKLALADGHVSDAALHFDKAVDVAAPADWTAEQKDYLAAECLAGRAAIAEQRRDWSTAARLYQQRVDADPRNAALRDHWATVLFRGGNEQQAFEQFDVAWRQDGALNPPEVSMGVMSVDAGNFRQAQRWFADAAKAHPKVPAVYFERSLALLFEDRAAEAAKDAQRAAELGMRTPSLTAQRGLIALAQGEWKQAETYFVDLLKDSPNNTSAQCKLVLALAEQNDKAKRAKAVAIAQKLIDQRPTDLEATAALGWAKFRAGDVDEAIELLQRAAELRGDATTLFLLARALHEAGRKDQALAAARKLRDQLEQPGIVPLRAAAKQWLPTVLTDVEEPTP